MAAAVFSSAHLGADTHYKCRYSVLAAATGANEISVIHPEGYSVPATSYGKAVIAKHGDATGSMIQMSGPTQIEAADLNNDGKMDFVVMNNGFISWFENEGSGTWSIQQLLGEVTNAASFALADLDRNNYQDVIVAVGSLGETAGDTVKLIEQNWGSQYEMKDLFPNKIFNPSFVAAMDINNDNYADVISIAEDCPDATYDSANALTARGACHAGLQYNLNYALPTTEPVSFHEKRFIASQYLAPAMVALADFDQDGKNDIVLAAADRLVWHRNHGPHEGSHGLQIDFSVQQTILGEGVSVARAADIDGDGKPDLLCISLQLSQVFWLRNEVNFVTGTGGFSDKRVISNNAFGVSDVQAADINADGWLDAVYAAEGFNAVYFVPNLGGQDVAQHENYEGEQVLGKALDVGWGPTVTIAGAELSIEQAIYGVQSIAPILTDCTTCQAGFFADPSSGEGCQGCGEGYASMSVGAVSSEACRGCPPGYHSSGAYSDSCSPCSADKYAKAGSPTCNFCPECYWSDPAASECTSCHMCTLKTYENVEAGSREAQSEHICYKESNTNITHIFDKTDDALERDNGFATRVEPQLAPPPQPASMPPAAREARGGALPATPGYMTCRFGAPPQSPPPPHHAGYEESPAPRAAPLASFASLGLALAAARLLLRHGV